VGRARRGVVRADDQPAARAAHRARRRGAVLLAAPRARGGRPRRDRQGALRDSRRPAGRGGADALPRRPPLALPVEPVGLPAHVHVLRDRADEVRPQPDHLRDPRPGASLPPHGRVYRGRDAPGCHQRAGPEAPPSTHQRRVHGHGRAADEPRQRARRLRAPARAGRGHLAYGDLDGGVDPRHRPDGERGPAGAAGALAARRRRRAALGADAGQRALPAGRRARRLPALVRGAPAPGVRGVPDARRRERPLRTGARAGRRPRAPEGVQGQPDPVQPDRRRVPRLRPGRDRRVPGRPRAARRPGHSPRHPRSRHRRRLRAAGRPWPRARSRS
jgi:hypothetical protein